MYSCLVQFYSTVRRVNFLVVRDLDLSKIACLEKSICSSSLNNVSLAAQLEFDYLVSIPPVFLQPFLWPALVRRLLSGLFSRSTILLFVPAVIVILPLGMKALGP